MDKTTGPKIIYPICLDQVQMTLPFILLFRSPQSYTDERKKKKVTTEKRGYVLVKKGRLPPGFLHDEAAARLHSAI